MSNRLNRKNKFLYFPVLTVIMVGLASCGGGKTYMPKPRGYFNIEVPDHSYRLYDTICPFTFEYSQYAEVVPYSRGDEAQLCWFNVHYPRFRATIHATYDPVSNNLKSYIEDSHKLVYKHVVKSTGIEEALVLDTANKVYGTIYSIEGDPACPYQFYLTDSTRHFFRAALYFDFKPNYDSLAPVLDYLKADMDHVVETFEWKTGVKN